MAETAGTAAEPEPDFKEDPSIDPYPEYARLRQTCPVARVAGRSGLRPFLVTGYADAKAALTEPLLAKDPRHGEAELTAAGLAHVYIGDGSTLTHNMLTTDPPDHSRLRKLVSAQFTTRRTAALAPRIQEFTDRLIDAFAPAGRAEFVGEFAGRLPALVIAELLGVPAADRDTFRDLAQGSMLPNHDPRKRVALEGLAAYVAEAVERKRKEPADDLISSLIADQGEDRLGPAEVQGSIRLLVIAGHETTVNLLGNGLLALLRHPDQLALLLDRPDLIPGAVEEMLRYDGPVERGTPRFAAQDVRIGGTLVPRGSVVSVVLNSADRDESEFPDADRFDVTRAPRGHLAFGHGLHFCLGAPLARLEARIAFETLLRRLPDLELAAAPEDLVYEPSSIMRGVAALPIRFRPTPGQVSGP